MIKQLLWDNIILMYLEEFLMLMIFTIISKKITEVLLSVK